MTQTYRQLERDGWVVTDGRHGTTVKTLIGPTRASHDLDTSLDSAARAFATRVARLNTAPPTPSGPHAPPSNRTRPAT